MDICSNGHDQIVFDNRHCPLCEANIWIENLKGEIQELKYQLLDE